MSTRFQCHLKFEGETEFGSGFEGVGGDGDEAALKCTKDSAGRRGGGGGGRTDGHRGGGDEPRVQIVEGERGRRTS